MAVPDDIIWDDDIEWETNPTPEEVRLKQMGQKPAAVAVGDALLGVPRQLGLTGRYAAEGLAQFGDIFTEPMRAGMEALGAPPTLPLSQYVSQTLTDYGVPSPEGANERVIGDASRFLASGGPLLGTAQRLAQTPGLLGRVAQNLAQAPAAQASAAAGAGGASGAVREAGGGPTGQFMAGLGGGLLAPGAMAAGGGLLRGTGRAVKNAVADAVIPLRQPQDLDIRISAALQQSGVDWTAVPNAIKQHVRLQAADALRSGGELDPAATARLVDFARVEATPTLGTLTLDPIQFTREKNLAKTGANSVDPSLHTLARVENDNNAALIAALNRQGANTPGDAFDAGQTLISALQGNVDRAQGNINTLYGQARDTAGRSFPLDARGFADRAFGLLQRDMSTGSVPADYVQRLNRISMGEEPMTVESAEQFKTLIAKRQRNSSDGNERHALGLLRQALDETDVLPLGRQPAGATAAPTNPGNLPAVADDATLGEEAIGAFNQARAANRNYRGLLERNPALRSVDEGIAQPDRFLDEYVTGQGATLQSVTALRDSIADNPTALTSVRNAMTRYLKGQALNGAADEVGNFSASAYNKALQRIGDRKLALFFEPDEVEALRAAGRVSSYTQYQPRGSAVNNSNSGALMAGKFMDFMDTLGQKIPILNIGPQLQVVARGSQSRSAQNISRGLLARPQRVPSTDQAREAIAVGGLLSLPRSNERKDKKRD